VPIRVAALIEALGYNGIQTGDEAAARAPEAGWTIVIMKNDRTTIFGPL
jgi:hypothetical protein